MIDVIELLSKIALSTEKLEVKRLVLLNGFLEITKSDYWCCAKVRRGGEVLEHITNMPGKFAESTFLHPVNASQSLLDYVEQKYDLNECHVISRQEMSIDTVEDDYLLSIEHLDHEHYSLIKFIRSGDRYTQEDQEQLKSLVSQIYWIHLGIDFEEDIIGNHTPLPISQSTITLTPRLHETLMHIVYNGYSNKQIAEAMGVSVHTVKEYVKSLQMHFLVSSRSELTASFLNDVHPISVNRGR